MALLHRAELRPTKLELIAAWLPTRPWYDGPKEPDLTRVTSYRFDDPAGEVGIETILVRDGDGPLLQIPLTYRAAPLDLAPPLDGSAEDWFVGNTDHSVLGLRWVYYAPGDPVYATTLAHTILTGASQAEEHIEGADGQLTRRASDCSVRGTGNAGAGPAIARIERVVEDEPTLIVTDSVELAVARVLDGSLERADRPALQGTWAGQATPMVLAAVL